MGWFASQLLRLAGCPAPVAPDYTVAAGEGVIVSLSSIHVH